MTSMASNRIETLEEALFQFSPSLVNVISLLQDEILGN